MVYASNVSNTMIVHYSGITGTLNNSCVVLKCKRKCISLFQMVKVNSNNIRMHFFNAFECTFLEKKVTGILYEYKYLSQICLVNISQQQAAG